MLCWLVGDDGEDLGTTDIEPIHDLDFCEDCGECLACFKDDPCMGVPNRDHVFVRSA